MKFLRIKHVTEKTGLSKATIYRLEAAGTFPKRVRLSLGAVAWHEDAIEVWMKERINAA